jgi:hypothetical protein
MAVANSAVGMSTFAKPRRSARFARKPHENTMRRLVPLTTLTGLVACVALPRGLAAQETVPAFEARVWLDRGAEPVLRRGEDVRVFYRTNEDAFAAIFRIDTDGRVHLIYPQHPDAIEVVRADRDYGLVFPHSPLWRVSEDPGVGYLFIVASPEPLDFSSFPYDEYHGWELSAVGDVVYTDPYVAIDDYVARIIPDWEQVPYALDFVTYSVGETYSYPRFLCYDCHTYQAYSSWNPYDYTCSTFRVVIWDDPYFYPRYRYSGVNVVVVQRPVRAALPRYEVTRRVVGDAVRPIVRTRAVVEYKEPATARGSGRVATTPAATRTTPAATRTSAAGTRTSTVAPRATAATSRSASALSSSPTRTQVVPQERPQERPRTGPQEAPDTTRSRPTLQRRPSSRLPVRTPPSRDPQQPSPTPSPSATPSRLPARTPAARPDASPARPSDPSGASARPTAPSSRQSSPSGRSVPSSGRDAPAASPSRPPARVTPAPSSARPSTGSSRPQAAPSRPQAAPSRPQAAPSRSSGSSGGGSRPSASPAPSRSSEPRSEPRSSDSRPSVRARPANPR